MTATAETTIVVPARFCGPPTTGNGGYTCGLAAEQLAGSSAVECTIRKPIPIARELRIERRGGAVVLLDADQTIIEAVPTEFQPALPHCITLAQAKSATEHSPAFADHPFPTCFVCGPERQAQDGLSIFPGKVDDQPGFPNLYAALWTPAPEFADAAGNVRHEFLWAAMDCPTGFAAGFPYQGKLVTGRLAVRCLAPLRASQHCVVMSWSLGNEGRKCHAAAALFNSNSEPCAVAKATWIRVA